MSFPPPDNVLNSMSELPKEAYHKHSQHADKWAALTLATVGIKTTRDEGYLMDAVSAKYYRFLPSELRRLIGALKIVNRFELHTQRCMNMNEAEYIPVSKTGFLWHNLEFDWDDLQKLDKLLNNG